MRAELYFEAKQDDTPSFFSVYKDETRHGVGAAMRYFGERQMFYENPLAAVSWGILCCACGHISLDKDVLPAKKVIRMAQRSGRKFVIRRIET